MFKRLGVLLAFLVVASGFAWYKVFTNAVPVSKIRFAGVKYHGSGTSFKWIHQDRDPLIPADMFSTQMYEGKFSYMPALKQLVMGDESNPTSSILRTGISYLFFDGEKVDDGFMSELQASFLKHGVTMMPVHRDFVFGPPCPIIGAVHNRDGSYMLGIMPPPFVDFDGTLDVAVFQPIRISKGKYSGQLMVPVLTLNPVNLTCMSTTEVVASAE